MDSSPGSVSTGALDPADARLLEAVQTGRPEAFDQFVERFGPMILAFGLRSCGHRQDAEDVFQETLVKVFTQLRTLQDPRALKTWLWRVVANECLMSRRGGRNPSRTLGFDDLEGGRDRSAPFQIPDPGAPSPEAAALRSEQSARLEKALQELPPDYRVILLLRDFEGLSTEEVAEILGLSEGNAKVRLHRARAALRRLMEDGAAGEGRP